VSTFSISGLSSGIDTASLISQLMTLAAQPQAALKNQLSTQQTVISAYQSINTKLTAMQAAADALKQPDTWSAAKATSTSPAVVATAVSGAQPGSATTFDVLRLATAQISTVAVAGNVVSSPASGIDLIDSTGTVHHVALTDGSANTVAAAVNNAAAGVQASVISTDAGQVLQFSSSASGMSGAFTINGLDNAPKTLVAAANAQIAVGDPATGGYTVSSNTNTFNNVIPGVSFSVAGLASAVSISVASDPQAMSDKMKALIDATNAALAELNADTAKGGPLAANYQINAIIQSILAAVSHGDSSSASFAKVGVQLNSSGALVFDPTAFAAAYAADPAKTRAAASASFATTLSKLASDASTATVSPLISSGTSHVNDLNKQISDWDSRLADQQTALQQKYTAMEVALSKLKSTSAWLTSTLSSLDNSNSNASSTTN
jgi:flagellar hook-associated protein 2